MADHSNSTWLQPYFPAGVPDYVCDLMKEEGISTGSIFRQITASELEELCSRVKIGHRVSLRNAYHNPKSVDTIRPDDGMLLANVFSVSNANGETSEVNVYERKRAKNTEYLPTTKKSRLDVEDAKQTRRSRSEEFKYTLHCSVKQKLDNRIVRLRNSDGKAVKKVLIGSSKTSEEVVNMLAEVFQVKDNMNGLSLVDSANQPVTFSNVAEYVASQRVRVTMTVPQQ